MFVSSFMDQLAPSTFDGDEPVCFALVERAADLGSKASSYETWIPGRLFERMLHLAGAYHLHVLGVVDSKVDTHLDHQQCESLERELEFLARLIPSDAALQRALDEVAPLATRAARLGKDAEIVVRPP
jgi:hypothetical protein